MACDCCNYRCARASSIVTTTEGSSTYLTITVPAGTDLTSPGCLNIGLFSSIPNTVSCARMVVTNGTVTLPVLQMNGNNYRPTRLKCRSILRTLVLTDPAHLLVKGAC